MIRGISGGQKKRVTTGEMIAGPKRTLFMVSTYPRDLEQLLSRMDNAHMGRLHSDPLVPLRNKTFAHPCCLGNTEPAIDSVVHSLNYFLPIA